VNTSESKTLEDKAILNIAENRLHLYLIRHGETEWAMSGRHTGSSDIPLTTNGEREARELGRHIRDIDFTQVLCSPLQSAQRTCELVGLNPAPEIEPDLAEWAFGDFEGLRLAEIHKIHPGWNVLADGCPNGEMPAQILQRTDRLIARLRKLKGNFALFSHGKFGSILAARWIGLPITESSHFPLGTASVSMLGYDHHHPEVSVIDLWNVVGHQSLQTLSFQTLT
jgi:probable phosphoglycerate mutase